MDELESRLESATIKATSPDQQLGATICGFSQPAVFMRPGAYHHYTESSLSRQLSQLLTQLWAEGRRAHLQILRRDSADILMDDAVEFGMERRRFRQGAELIRTEASSPEQHIRVRTRALVDWDVELVDGMLHRYSEAEFLSVLTAVLSEAFMSHQGKLSELRDEVYGEPGWAELT